MLCLLYVGYRFWVTDLVAGWTQEQLRASVPSRAAASAAKPSTLGTSPKASGELPGRGPLVLQIPRIGLDLVVLGGVSRDQLRRGPGLLPGTPAPGLAGNSVIAAHRITWGAPFSRLDELRPGDRILAGTAGDLVTYTVVPPEGGPITDGHRIVMPSDLSVARQQVGQHRLTLVTCHPPISGTHRLVVIARQTEPEVTTPPSAITALSARDVPDLGQLDFGSGQPPDWSEVLPPGVTALLIWATASRLSTSLDPRPRWRRLVRWIGLRAVGAAAAAVPLIVAFDRLARLWPTG